MTYEPYKKHAEIEESKWRSMTPALVIHISESQSMAVEMTDDELRNVRDVINEYLNDL